jgi:nicotinamidase-related amidase
MKDAALALVLVDIQGDFWQPLQDAPHASAFPGNVRTLLSVARARRLLVVHTRAEFRPDGHDWMLFYGPHGRGSIPCIAGSAGAKIEDFAAPQPGEPVIAKQVFDGFTNSDLERVLRERNIHAILVAGLMTSVCVLFTATSAYLKRIVPIVVTDACADESDRHEATLRRYGVLCFQTVTTAQVRDDWAGVIKLAERYVSPLSASRKT